MPDQVKIIKPTIGGHDRSSFRELLDLWSERGLCKIQDGPSTRSSGYGCDPDSPEAKCWMNGMGDILLYDFPILDRLRHDYNMCLFSNTYLEGEKNKKWVFWPWRSRIFHDLKNDLRKDYESRDHDIGFIGSPTNDYRNRLAPSWSEACDSFHFSGGKIDHAAYLNRCSGFKFGLCLRGVGPKCLRDVEYMGMGTVPIFTPGVSTEYYDPPIKDIHYIEIESAQEAKSIIERVDKNKWEDMSAACIEWFEKNCSIEGSFKTTMEIING